MYNDGVKFIEARGEGDSPHCVIKLEWLYRSKNQAKHLVILHSTKIKNISKREFFARKRGAFLFPNIIYPRSKIKGVFAYFFIPLSFSSWSISCHSNIKEKEKSFVNYC